jgi:hypothetical protein
MQHAQHTIPKLDRKGLREFGLTTGAIVMALFGGLLPWLFEFSYPVWPWVVGAILGLWSVVAPSALNPMYQLWMRIGLLLSRITTPLILGLVFFLIIVPAGMLMRLFGKDPMARSFDKKAKSYRVASRNTPKDHMEKPF